MTTNEHKAVSELRKFLPEWGYPDYVIAAICLELQSRLHHPEKPLKTGRLLRLWCWWFRDDYRCRKPKGEQA